MIYVKNKEEITTIYFPKHFDSECSKLVLKSESSFKNYYYDVVDSSTYDDYFVISLSFVNVVDGEYVANLYDDFDNEISQILLVVGELKSNIKEYVFQPIYKEYVEKETKPKPIIDMNSIVFISEGTSTVKLTRSTTSSTLPIVNLEYSTDGEIWDVYTIGSEVTASPNLYFRGIDNTSFGGGLRYYHNFNIEGDYVRVEGNIMSLLDYEKQPTEITINQCFFNIFKNCTKLVDASNLLMPATELAVRCYDSMFQDCISLKKAPKELPAMQVSSSSYYMMFKGCTALTEAPQLLATELANKCYQSMFEGCSSLVKVTETLPATELPNHCYQSMFQDCISLKKAPQILGTKMTPPFNDTEGECCQDMFKGCVSLTEAPYALLPKELKLGCYYRMFEGCVSLRKAPELLATQLHVGCYENMFYGCTSLNEITCLATDLSFSDCTTNWVSGVSPTGTFYRDANTDWSIGHNGIPEGWEIIPPYPTPTLDDCILFETEGTSNISIAKNGTAPEINIEYSFDGTEWFTYTVGDTLTASSNLYFRGIDNDRFATSVRNHNSFVIEGDNVTVKGNLMSLLDYNNPPASITPNCFTYLFDKCTNLVDASELILSSTQLANYCYSRMFAGCTSLTTAPQLLATELAEGCYEYMFGDCTSLTTAPVLLATELASYCYDGMFLGCTSLTTAPVLPATELASWCYYRMFEGCTALSSITCFATDISASNCTGSWVYNVAPSGTFYRDTNTEWRNGVNGIPEGWNIIPPYPEPVSTSKVILTLNDNTTKEYEFEDGIIPDYTVNLPWEDFSDNIIKIDILNGITSIGYASFKNCSNLISLSLPNSLKTIGNNAFQKCFALPKLIIPDSVTSIGQYAFGLCSGLTSVEIGNSVTNIEKAAFYQCYNLTTVDFGSSVTSIGINAFRTCSSLTSVVISESVKQIDTYAFEGCTNLTSVTFEDSATGIGEYAFEHCSNLTTVDFGNSVTNIGDYAFAYCSSLTSITIPDSVKNIGNEAFQDCVNLTSIELGNGVFEIGRYAFAYCPSFTSITIPDSVSFIGDYAFQDCANLTSVVIGSYSIGYASFLHCNLNLIKVKRTNIGEIDRYTFGAQTIGTLLCPKGSDYSRWLNYLPSGWKIEYFD